MKGSCGYSVGELILANDRCMASQTGPLMLDRPSAVCCGEAIGTDQAQKSLRRDEFLIATKTSHAEKSGKVDACNDHPRSGYPH